MLKCVVSSLKICRNCTEITEMGLRQTIKAPALKKLVDFKIL